MDTPKKIAEDHGLQYAESIPQEWTAPDLLANVPVAWARDMRILPARRGGECLLLVSSPDCLGVLQRAELATGIAMTPVMTDERTLLRAIEMAYYDASSGGAPAGSSGDSADLAQSAAAPRRVAPAAPEPAPVDAPAAGEDLLAGGDASPVTKAINEIILNAVRCGASDIHFEPVGALARVRYRIDGVLREQPSPKQVKAETIASRIKVMARMDIAERRLPQDGMAQVRAGEKVVDIRVSSVPVSDGERLVLRLLDRDNAWADLSSLGMGEDTLAAFREMLSLSNGLIVVSGPTGSGKTTTLYSALSSIDASQKNILTIEDPVEYRLPAIGQIQVKPKIGLTFAAGLRHILRQDPDVVLVGETRDAETAEIAIRAALTGHLVFTTLHTNDAPSAVARLADMGIEPYLLASCMRGVLAQRLVRKLCDECKRRVAGADGLSAEPASLVREAGGVSCVPRGCGRCIDGYRGRVGLFELMPCSDEMSAAIHGGAQDAGTIRAMASRLPGYCTLRTDAARKIRAGVTSAMEAAAAL